MRLINNIPILFLCITVSCSPIEVINLKEDMTVSQTVNAYIGTDRLLRITFYEFDQRFLIDGFVYKSKRDGFVEVQSQITDSCNTHVTLEIAVDHIREVKVLKRNPSLEQVGVGLLVVGIITIALVSTIRSSLAP